MTTEQELLLYGIKHQVDAIKSKINLTFGLVFVLLIVEFAMVFK